MEITVLLMVLHHLSSTVNTIIGQLFVLRPHASIIIDPLSFVVRRPSRPLFSTDDDRTGP
jgi:hypothetical protein